MSSRLFDRLREKMGAGYYVRSDHDVLTDHGVLEISTGVDNKRVKEVIIAIIDECQKLIDTKVSETELKKVKESLIGSIYLGLESSDSLTGFYGDQVILRDNIKTPFEIIKEIKVIKSKDIQKVAKNIFQNKNLNLAIIGPFKDKKPFHKILRF